MKTAPVRRFLKPGHSLALLLGLGLTASVLFGTATAAATNYIIFVGGKATGKTTVLLNGELYVPLSLVKQAGLTTVLSKKTLTLGGLGSAVSGGSDQLASLQGCLGETLFNGLWRLKVVKVAALHKDDQPLAPGWGVTVEVRNGWKDNLSPSDSGFASSTFITDPEGNTVKVDPYNVQELQSKRLPPGGSFTYQLAFYYPYGTTADQVHPPQKLLLEADPKHIDSIPAGAGAHYSTSTPSFRVDLSCQK